MAECKVALMLADGFEETEALATYDLLLRAGVLVKTVSVKNGKCVKCVHGYGVDADMTLSELMPGGIADAACLSEKLDMLILPGGMPGTTNLASDARLIALIIEMDRRKKQLAAICAAPTVYAQAGILTGFKATCYPGMGEVLLNNGADYKEEAVVRDGHFTTSRGPGTVISFALTLISRLLGEEKAKEIRADIVSRDEIY